MIEYKREETQSPPPRRMVRSRVIGLGGAGSNSLDQIALDGIEEAELVCVDTDIRTLKSSTAHQKIQLGRELTRGLGAGGDPELGAEAAEEVEGLLRAAVRGQSLVFLCVGLGGGTGSGSAPLLCRLAREEGAFVTVFATMPFSFEGRRRIRQAQAALQELEQVSDALVTFDNDRMGEVALAKDGIQQAFTNADKLISQSVRAVAALVSQRGLVQIGMDDLLSALKNPSSRCLFGHGMGSGKNRAHDALRQALRSPLLDEGRLLNQASSTLVHVVGGPSMTLAEVEQLMSKLNAHVHPDAHILFGMSVDERMGDRLSLTVFSSLTLEELRRAPVAREHAQAPAPVEPAPVSRHSEPAAIWEEDDYSEEPAAQAVETAVPEPLRQAVSPRSADDENWEDSEEEEDLDAEEAQAIDEDEDDLGEEEVDKEADEDDEVFDRHVPRETAHASAGSVAVEVRDEQEDVSGDARVEPLHARRAEAVEESSVPESGTGWRRGPERAGISTGSGPVPAPVVSPFRLGRTRKPLEDEVQLIEDDGEEYEEEVVWTDEDAGVEPVELERNQPPGFGPDPEAESADDYLPRGRDGGPVLDVVEASGEPEAIRGRSDPQPGRRARPDPYQEELELGSGPRGQFDDSKIPTVVDGENLDIPTYLRKKANR